MEDILTVSQLIKVLQAIEDSCGDLPVVYAEDGPFGQYVGISTAYKIDDAHIYGHPNWRNKPVACLVDDM